MIARGIDFGKVIEAAGASGFTGEGYRHDWITSLLGRRRRGVTLRTKTILAHPYAGNMPLGRDFRPREFKPRCIAVAPPWHEAMVNAVKLSCPGVDAILATGRLQAMTVPFIIGIGFIGDTFEERCEEMRRLARAFAAANLPDHVGFEFNPWCPNMPHGGMSVEEIHNYIDIFRHELLERDGRRHPFFIKTSVEMPVQKLLAILNHPSVDGVCTTNTVSWGSFPDVIKWKRIWGSLESPLVKRGFSPGGYTGPELVSLCCPQIAELRRLGYRGQINAGGGIRRPIHVKQLRDAGANSFMVGTANTLAPHHTGAIVDEAWR